MNALPTADDIDELLAFLPPLYAPGFRPVREPSRPESCGDARNDNYPEYEPLVMQFVAVAGKPCWSDYGYSPGATRDLMDTEGAIESASLQQVKSMLTFCVRGERFCDGHWGAMIEERWVERLLKRLQAIRQRC